jgi:hypothetical protein
MTVEWLDHAFVVLRSSTHDDGPPRVPVSDRAKRDREDPGFHQHFEGTVDPGNNRIAATWTKSHDDGNIWQHDFDLTYPRL